MALSNQEVQLLRDSFRDIATRSEQAADRFYKVLFEKDPNSRVLFTNDIGRQGTMLMSKLGIIVSELHNMESLAPMLEGLAMRHVAYGVKKEHYPVVGDVLIQVLSEMLDDEFTPEMEAVWIKVYGELSDLMTEIAYPD